MRTALLLPLAGLVLAACGGADRDLDGFGRDDCDDEDPLVYPGAPDAPGDGIDGDCDGEDPPLAFVGAWLLRDIEATYFSLNALLPGSGVGTLEIEDDLATVMDITVSLDPTLLGFELQAPFVLSGESSVVPGPDQFDAVLDGDLFDEPVQANMGCALSEDDVVDCRGGLKALDINFDVYATFDRL